MPTLPLKATTWRSTAGGSGGRQRYATAAAAEVEVVEEEELEESPASSCAGGGPALGSVAASVAAAVSGAASSGAAAAFVKARTYGRRYEELGSAEDGEGVAVATATGDGGHSPDGDTAGAVCGGGGGGGTWGDPEVDRGDHHLYSLGAKWNCDLLCAPVDVYPEDPTVPCADRARHALLSLRLRKAYVVYCFVCCGLSAVVCVSTFGRVAKLKSEGRHFSVHRWHTWETIVEVLCGLAVLIETLSTLWLAGRKQFIRDCWCLFDATVVALTLLNWSLLFVRRVFLPTYVVPKVDMWLFSLRFVMQPCRVLAAVSMVRRVRNMQQSTTDISFDVHKDNVFDCGGETPQSDLLTLELKAEITDQLPTWCRYREWQLAYSPHEHGTSMQTFYRHQAGANVILLRDDEGRVFGGFSPEPWRKSEGGSLVHGRTQGGESFVFATPPLDGEDDDSPSKEADMEVVIRTGNELLKFYHENRGVDAGGVLLLGDERMIAFGDALVILDLFRLGTSAACLEFASPALAGGREFHIVDFECWLLQ